MAGNEIIAGFIRGRLTRIMRHIAALLSLSILLTACSSGQLSKDQPLSATSNSGVIVLGMDLQSDFKSPVFGFLRYDPRTGKVDQSGVKTVTRSQEGLSAGQKFGAVMSGQTSLAKGHQYFVFELPPGEWILSSVSGTFSDGVYRSYSATSYMSKGTIAFQSGTGVAHYVGEYRVTGNFGESLQLHVLDENADAAQAALKTYPNITMPLQGAKPSMATFSCETMKNFMTGEEMCKWKTITVKVGS
jgi:hypothetical protein